MWLTNSDSIGLLGALLFALVAIMIVFLILGIIICCVVILSKIKFKEKVKATPVRKTVKEEKKLTLEDIKDEDMMVAALVAMVDYVEETKTKDARLVSIKQIG